MSAEEEFNESIEQLVSYYLDSYSPEAPQDRPKAIHDALWGTHILSPAEIDILDSPLIQRLRGIHQTSSAFLTYPSATHTRFEHSLGVLIVATKMADTLNSKHRGGVITPKERQELRLAGLLHDSGHGVLSHVSERFYKRHPWITNLKRDPFFQAAKASEILTYKILKSRRFRKFFLELKERHRQRDPVFADTDLDTIANFILGQAPSPDKQFLAMIVNGPFDADKLDYIPRDSYFTGLKMVVDIERLLYAMDVEHDAPKEGGGTEDRLVIAAAGASVMEQILFSKIQLYALMYRHPKVQASDLMLEQFLSYMHDLKGDIRQRAMERMGTQIVFVKPTDFLRYSDFDLLNETLHEENYPKEIIRNLRNRRLLQKALVLSSLTVEKKDMSELTRLIDHPFGWDIRIGLRTRIHDALPAGTKLNVHDIVVDLPETPPLNEAALSIVRLPGGGLVSMNELFPSHDWLQAFIAKKWRGHVYCKHGYQKPVNEAARAVLQGYPYNIGLNGLATSLANIR